jgi:uncharacterized membrane protein
MSMPSRFPLLPGILLGVGIGGMVDGIVLHQLLQWHNMVSGWYPPTSLENLRINTVADGLFHSVTWLVIVAGIFALWRAAQKTAPPRMRWLAGALLVGWGLFNVVEGLIDHTILGVHHVNETGPPATWVWWISASFCWAPS